MTRTSTRFLASCAIAPLVMAGSQTAFAQDEASAANNKTIVVTARLVEESLQDIPVAITAFNAEEMQRKSISELEDVALLTPGLTFEDYSNGGFGTPVIRGATQFSITGLEQNVSVLVDGVYIPRSYAFDVGSMNLERIEVVKGPQSALYGANAFAGAVNYISFNRSLTEVSGSAKLEVSENGGFDISGKVSVPLVDDMLAMRLAIGKSKFGGDWVNAHPDADADISPGTDGTLGGYDKTSIVVGASFRPVDALTIDFDYYNFDTSSEARAQYRLSRADGDLNCSLGGAFLNFGVPPENQLFCGQLPNAAQAVGGGDTPFVIDPRSYGLESESEIYRVNVRADLTDQISVNYLFGHSAADVFSAGGSDRDPLIGPAVNAFTYNPVGGFNYDSHELRLQYQGDNGLYLMVGGFLQDGLDIEQSGGQFEVFGDLTPLTTFNGTIVQTDLKTKAVFGRVAVPLMDERLTIGLEGRYTDEQKTVDGLLYEDTYFTPRASIDYKVTDDSLLYISAAKGVKSGGINGFLPAVGFDPAERFYGPDTNWTYEIGLKNTFMNGLARLNLAAFYIDWSDLQLQTGATGGGVFDRNIITNIGGATSKGIEIDGDIEIAEGIVLNAGLAYIDASFNSGTNSARITRSGLCGTVDIPSDVCNFDGDVSGNALPRSSKLQWNVGASVETPVTDSMDFFGRVDVAGQSKQYISEINVTEIQPRTLVNGRLGIRGDRWSFSVWGKNLFDKQYVSNAFFISIPFFTDIVPTMGNRRRVGATVTFDY